MEGPLNGNFPGNTAGGPSPFKLQSQHQQWPTSYQVQVECCGECHLGPHEQQKQEYCSPPQKNFGYAHSGQHASPPHWLAAPNMHNGVQQAPPPPSSLNVQLPPDLPENVEVNTQSLRDMQLLWEEWHALAESDTPREQASEDMRRLARRTASAVGAASQGAVTRQQMQELLHFATEVMRVREECQAAEFLARLADNLQSIPLTRSGALVTNIVTGGRQHMMGATQTQTSRPSVRAALGSQVAAKARSEATAKNRTLVRLASGGLLQMAGAALAGVLAWEAVKRGAVHAGGMGGRRQRKNRAAVADKRRAMCEASNARAHAYIREVRRNRFNVLWHDPPPVDACPYPHSPHHSPWYSAEDPPSPYG